MIARTPIHLSVLAVLLLGARASAQAPAERESWDVLLMQGNRVGYTHVVERPIEREGKPLLSIDSESQITAKRFGEKLEQLMKFQSVETPEGELREFRAELQMGTAPVVTTGIVDGDKLRLETVAGEKRETAELSWKAGTRGFNALEQSLRSAPLKQGERREFEALMPVFNQVAKITLEAKGPETVKLLDGSRELQRIESRTSVSGFSIDTTLWVDDQGQALKSESPLMSQVTYRTTREEALRPSDEPAGELALSTLVHVKDMPKNLRTAERQKYRVTLKGGNPAKILASLGWQQVESTGEHEAGVVVARCGPQQPPAEPAPESDHPTAADREPNSLIESDNLLVKSLAAEGVGTAQTPAEKATALEKFVHEKITKKDFSTVFASAAEVAKSCEGDCTEHGVLLAALLRANEIPSRTVVGLVYVRSLKAFGYHMWTEAWLGDRWVPLDATLGHGGTDIGHLAIATSNLAGASPYAVFLPVAQVLGQLEIEVVKE